MRLLRPILALLPLLLAMPVAQAEGGVALIAIQDAIGPATSGYFEKAHRRAVESGASLVVLQIDTPGGLDSAMRDIIKTILNSPIPVACHVAPGGARAASAGTYILYACHVAAMAPATNLCAATPVPLSVITGSVAEDVVTLTEHVGAAPRAVGWNRMKISTTCCSTKPSSGSV